MPTFSGHTAQLLTQTNVVCTAGATLLTPYKREGNLIWPTLLDHVTPSMRLAWEEPFGPVVPVVRVGSAEAAVAHCNASKFGLQGCVFTRDINRAIKISDSMETGTVQVGAACIAHLRVLHPWHSICLIYLRQAG